MKMNLQTRILLTLISISLKSDVSKTLAAVPEPDETCIKLPLTEDEIYDAGQLWTFDPTNGSLIVDLAPVMRLNSCLEAGDRKKLIRVDLISTSTPNIKNSCQKLKKDSFVQSSGVVNATSTRVAFQFVQGLYFIRIANCWITRQGSCKIAKAEEGNHFCIGGEEDKNTGLHKPLKFVLQLPDSEDEELACDFRYPTNVSADVIYAGEGSESVTLEHHCDVNIRAVIPLCSAQQTQDTVTLTLVDVGLGDVCTFADFDAKQKGNESKEERLIPLKACDEQDSNVTSNHCGGISPAALLDHRVQGLSRNASYCLFFRLNHPNCQGQFGCVFYTETISCGLLEGAHIHGFRMQLLVTEPVFIGVVSLILIVSLALLAWTIIQCSKKKPGTPLMTQTQIGMMKKPPRSLTEDDLEHISRLPSQEIVLVYFPDTKRFKDLNRKLRNWLITLDVNDVKDIYDEKATEEVLRNPEQWVRDALAGPEKRIILVCSRLAYECLTAIKRGISSPRFVESDPHFGLLTRTVQYLDREMRGNYRNLICVRYEDLKICSRQYSSEAFNLVPGTEYGLPQHLEDIYRWIHPRQPNPDCWAESRPEVRELLEAIKQYRHHDDNIFTVQFSATNTICTDQ